MHTFACKFISQYIFVTAALVPLIYITFVVLKRLFWIRNSYFHKVTTLCLRKRSTKSTEEPLPDQLVHPSAYYGSSSLPNSAEDTVPMRVLSTEDNLSPPIALSLIS